MSDAMQQRDSIFDISDELQEISELNISDIEPDPNQPRQTFDEDSLKELAQSLHDHGQLQPILVRPHPSEERRYIIIGGERRFRACQRLGRERIQAIIRRDVDERKARELALVDNLQREDLSPFEEAAGYARLMEEFGFTQEQVAESMGKGRTTVTQTLALNRLPERIKEEGRQQKVSKSMLIELAQIDNVERQLALWEKIKKGGTVRAAREAKQDTGTATKKSKKSKVDVPMVLGTGRDFVQRLERIDVEHFRAKPKDYNRFAELYTRLGKVLETARQAMEHPTHEDTLAAQEPPHDEHHEERAEA